jgi:hypothetical protein
MAETTARVFTLIDTRVEGLEDARTKVVTTMAIPEGVIQLEAFEGDGYDPQPNNLP